MRLEFDGRSLNLPPEAIAQVGVIKDFNNQDTLDVTIAREWIAALADLTQDPQGRLISIFICGALVAEPALQGQISKGRFYVVGDPQVIHKAAVFLQAKSCRAAANS
ncbi:hypothetical protein [Cypionkella aquatica]|uniref:hypothetical protein n=1 Tax=Cypionkella aquatica TaxID=1756042 RepID=UPI0024E11203|nr:hypothetical protein [Cypionkella aquatica]